MKKIDETQFVQAVREIAAANKNYIYESPDKTMCRYEYGGKPSCLIGHALAAVGVSIESLAQLDEGFKGADSLSTFSAYDALQKMECSKAVSEWARHAQNAQDNGMNWGRAVERADRLVTL